MPLPLPRRMRPDVKPGHAHNRELARLRAQKMQFAPGALVDVTTNGTFVRPRASVVNRPGGQVNVQQFRIFGVKPDYLECNSYTVSFNGSTRSVTIGSATVLVAKNYKCRRTPFDGHLIPDATVGNISYTYDLTNRPDGTRRTASGQGFTEVQVVIPQYLKSVGTFYDGDLIIAIENPVGGTGVLDASGNEITWLDKNNDGRAWAETI